MCDDKQQIELFFYEAMRKGYAGNGQNKTIPELPGSKMISYAREEFRLVDCWFVGAGGKSAGHTTIFYEDQPIWVMNYHGEYQDGAIAFLKKALAVACGWRDSAEFIKHFDGCRGPSTYTEANLHYANIVRRGSHFWHFSGFERIAESSAKVLGWHEYEGFGLL